VTEAPQDWDDAAVRSPGGHVLQSAAWAKIREAQGWTPEFLRFGAPLPVALILWRPLLGRRPLGYIPRGPIIGDAAQLGGALERIGELARERQAVFIKVDPEIDPDTARQPLHRAGFRRGQDIQPILATLELDLAPEEDALFAGLDKDTRWSVRQAAKRGVAVREAKGEEDLQAFYALYSETGRRAGFITRPWDYYRRMWGAVTAAGHGRIRLAERDGLPVAGALTWRCGEREVYQTAATNEAAREVYAAYALLWQCIIEARNGGAHRFDFGGIPVDISRKDDPMYGPYQFKKGFGGVPRQFVGAHDVVPHEGIYRVYSGLEPKYTAALRLLDRLRR
jgi:lipid II:glycine glycyltransferase (peptidoglycan interpeptide bridge formation enzyme)